MTQESVDQTRPSTRAIVVDEALCRRIAGFLFCEPAPITNAFLGEPIKEVLAMVDWCIEHEGPTFDPAKVLPRWAAKRGRGRWSDRPNRAARTIWGEVPATLHGCSGCAGSSRDLIEVVEDHQSLTFFEGDQICAECAGNHGVL